MHGKGFALDYIVALTVVTASEFQLDLKQLSVQFTCRCFQLYGHPTFAVKPWNNMVEATSNKLEGFLRKYNMTNLVVGSHSLKDISKNLLVSLSQKYFNNTIGVILNMGKFMHFLDGLPENSLTRNLKVVVRMFIMNKEYDVKCGGDTGIQPQVAALYGEHSNESILLQALCGTLTRPGKELDFTVDTQEFMQVLRRAHPRPSEVQSPS